jgi:predicted nucleotidyltransferase
MKAPSKRIMKLVAKVVEVASPERVVLFGSRAGGAARKDSDLDLLVIADPEGNPKRAAVRIRAALPWSGGLDLIVRSPKQLEERLRRGDPFFQDILSTGRTVYEKPRS